MTKQIRMDEWNECNSYVFQPRPNSLLETVRQKKELYYLFIIVLLSFQIAIENKFSNKISLPLVGERGYVLRYSVIVYGGKDVQKVRFFESGTIEEQVQNSNEREKAVSVALNSWIKWKCIRSTFCQQFDMRITEYKTAVSTDF